MKARTIAVLLIGSGLIGSGLITSGFLLAPCYAQNNSASPRQTARPRNNKFTIAYPTSTRTWNVGSKVETGGDISQAIGDALAKQLSTKGFVRVPALDTQCCTLQVELTDVTSAQSHLAITARVILMDIDKQNLYSQVFRGEDRSGSSISAAATAFAKNVVADDQFMRALTGS